MVTGSIFGLTPVYNKTICFEKFSFPDASSDQKNAIRELAERLDAHRKRQLETHSELTLTEMYNVLEQLKNNLPLNEKEKRINNFGLISSLLEMHNGLDGLVATAYGWRTDLTEAQILENLVGLNLERNQEEARGTILYLRPEYQNPKANPRDSALELPEAESAAVVLEPVVFPKSLGEQSQAIRNAIRGANPMSSTEITKRFKGAKAARVAELLELLVGLGQIRLLDGRYSS